MSTKIELIVKITDEEKGVAVSSMAMSGEDYEETKHDFMDHVYFNGQKFVERATENPKFEKPNTKKPVKKAPASGGSGKTAAKPGTAKNKAGAK